MKESFADAKNCFENAIAINPSHVQSIQHLVSAFYVFIFCDYCRTEIPLYFPVIYRHIYLK